jgi:predicted lactoylglutathione lyase
VLEPRDAREELGSYSNARSEPLHELARCETEPIAYRVDARAFRNQRTRNLNRFVAWIGMTPSLEQHRGWCATTSPPTRAWWIWSLSQHHDGRGPGEGGVCGETGDQTDQESRSASHGAATSLITMASIESVTLEVADPTAVNRFYTAAFGLDTQVRLRASEAPTTGFRGFTLSLTVSQPATVNGLIGAALDAGASTLKPAAKSLWGYGGVVRAPDGTIWKVATSAKKDTGPATRQIDQIVLLLGVADMAASKRFYVDRGLAVAKSFGRKYVEFATPSSPVKLALYGHRALAKDAGVSPEGTGSHRLMIGSDAGPFTDPDGFAWETASL